MQVTTYEDLDIWKLSVEVSVRIYKLTGRGLFLKDFGITDQLRRAAVSMASNIAEGFERNNNNEFVYFLKVSKGSWGELRTQLFICCKIAYITQDEYNNLSYDLLKLSKMTGKFITYFKKNKVNGETKSR